MAEEEYEKPPVTEIGVIGWMGKNLFGNWWNTLLTFLSVGIVVLVARALGRWIFFQAEWRVVTTNLRVLLIGRYPREEAWRVLACIGIIALLTILTIIIWRSGRQRARRWIVIGWVVTFPLIGVILRGFGEDSFVLPRVSAEIWSGLLLTLVLATVGILASFPIGVVLALGRRSRLRAIKIISTAYIEGIRGVPLISVLFMSQLLLPLFLPPQIRLGTVVRALTGMTLFSAAYTAENIRGGLAAVPRGQYEAATALGLNNALATLLIILPQALRAVIPAIVGQFISLFKDTTLVVIVGLLDVLGIAKAVTGQREFIGMHQEVYSFVALLFFIFCFSLSYASKHLEKSLGVGTR